MNLKKLILDFVKKRQKRDVFIKYTAVFAAVCFSLTIIQPAYALNYNKTDSGKYQDHTYNAYMTPSQAAAEEATLENISEESGVFKINGKMTGTVINNKVYDAKTSGTQKEIKKHTELLHKKIKTSLEKKGLLIKSENGYKIKKISDKEINTVIKTISKEIKISDKTINSVLKAEAEVKANTNTFFSKIAAKIKTIVNVQQKEETQKTQYDKVVEELTQQTGMDKKEIENAFNSIEQSKLHEVVGILVDFFAQGGSIINCAVKSVAAILGINDTGYIAFELFLSDAAAGLLNQDSINNGQFKTSAYAINKTLNAHGKKSAGFEISFEDFIKDLEQGQSAILWVNQNHFITVTKETDHISGKPLFIVEDINTNEAVTYTEQGFKTAMTGGNISDKNGNTVKDINGNEMKYQAANSNGKIVILTDSAAISISGTVLSTAVMQQTTGANIFKRAWKNIKKGFKKAGQWVYNGFKAIGKGIGNAAKAVWGGIKKVASQLASAAAKVTGYVAGVVKAVFNKIFKKTEKRISGEQYNNVLDTAAQQTGIDRDDLQEIFDGLDTKTFNRAITILTKLFNEKGSMIGCVASALAAALDIPHGIAALQAFLIDVATRPVDMFVMDGQLSITPYAANEVLKTYGISSKVLTIGLDQFMSSLNVGESAIIFVRTDTNGKSYHSVNVTKDIDPETGKEIYIIEDNLVKNGGPTAYTPQGFKNVMSGKGGVDKDGNEINISYKAKIVEFGQMLVVTDSKGVKKNGQQEILEGAYEYMMKGEKDTEKFFDKAENLWSSITGIFKKKPKETTLSKYQDAEKHLKNMQNAAMLAAVPVAPNGTAMTQAKLDQALKNLESAEQLFLERVNALALEKESSAQTERSKGNTSKALRLENEAKSIRQNAQFDIETSRLDIEATALRTQAKHSDRNTQEFKTISDRFIAGAINEEEFTAALAVRNAGKEDFIKKNVELNIKINNLIDRKTAAGIDTSNEKMIKEKVNGNISMDTDYILSRLSLFVNLKSITASIENGDIILSDGEGKYKSISPALLNNYPQALRAITLTIEEENKIYNKLSDSEASQIKEERSVYIASVLIELQEKANKKFLTKLDEIEKYYNQSEDTSEKVNLQKEKAKILTAMDNIRSTLLDLSEKLESLGAAMINAYLANADAKTENISQTRKSTVFSKIKSVFKDYITAIKDNTQNDDITVKTNIPIETIKKELKAPVLKTMVLPIQKINNLLISAVQILQ